MHPIRKQQPGTNGKCKLFIDCLQTPAKYQEIINSLCRRDQRTLTCSPNHVHSFAADSSLQASALGAPTRAHGIRYCDLFSQMTVANCIGNLTLPPRSLASGAVPAYSCVMAPRVTDCILMSRLCGDVNAASAEWILVSCNILTIANLW